MPVLCHATTMVYIFSGKRLFDVVWSVFFIVILSPLFLLVCLAIVFFDNGPVLFVQRRVGRYGVPFSLYKFRSMPVDTPKVPSDRLGYVRLTPIGRFIRRTSIDELPQLFNILKGDMSVVGPRPSMLDQGELIRLRRNNGSLSLRPGLTGLAQIRGFNGMTVQQKAAYDGLYADSFSFPTDLNIIFHTLFYLFSTPPLY